MKNIAMLMAATSLMAMYGPVYAKKGGAEGAAPEKAADPVPGSSEPAKERKSIVPAGWKSKKDALKTFIDAQSSGKDGFEYPAFFALMRKNEVPEEKVAHYEGQVSQNLNGARGRAVMTLRNILVPIIRKRGHVIALDGSKIDMDLPKPAPSGAAKAQAEKKAAESQASA